ncbi:hypothetical protein GCM10007973_00630 [Polymorphobacter multimanifer]|nr:hypothetical protein GCM10007973_00630 [Polymorphobacter multimanifer]
MAKHDRMELRKALGNRVIQLPYVRPYLAGPDYLIAHACFACQKSWKRTGSTEHGCPECGKPLALMGRTFRTPKKRENEQWEKLRKLWEAGFRFWSYRSFPEAEAYPDDLREVDAWIARNPKHPMRLKP